MVWEIVSLSLRISARFWNKINVGTHNLYNRSISFKTLKICAERNVGSPVAAKRSTISTTSRSTWSTRSRSTSSTRSRSPSSTRSRPTISTRSKDQQHQDHHLCAEHVSESCGGQESCWVTEVLDVGHRYRGVVHPAHWELGVENRLEKHGSEWWCFWSFLSMFGCVPWLRWSLGHHKDNEVMLRGTREKLVMNHKTNCSISPVGYFLLFTLWWKWLLIGQYNGRDGDM